MARYRSDIRRLLDSTGNIPASPFGGEELDGEALLALLELPAWHADALCKEHPEITWFPEKGDHPGAAKAICQRCLVVDECRRWALRQGPSLDGIWGGLTPPQRRRLLAAKPRSARDIAPMAAEGR